jgi:hypothetical protein
LSSGGKVNLPEKCLPVTEKLVRSGAIPRSKRMRKIGIMAMVRKLLIALWRFVETGVLPEGAVEVRRDPIG